MRDKVYSHFGGQTEDISDCSSIRFVFILFYFILFLLALCNPLVNSIL